MLATAPLLLAQARLVRRRTVRLPEASSSVGEVGIGTDPLTLLVVGDSVAAGMGVDDHRNTIAGRLAAELHARDGRPVRWRVHARSGDDTAAVLARLGTAAVARDAELIVVSVGVNDTKDLRSDRFWRAHLTRLLALLSTVAPRATVILLAIPPIERFPALPRPLSTLLGARARTLDAIGADVASRFPQVRRVELSCDLLDLLPEPFATDGFHPGAVLHAELARLAACLVPPVAPPRG